MGLSSGTGHPIWFKCTPCRSTTRRDSTSRSGMNYEVTGRRKRRHFQGGSPGRVDTEYVYEYRCLDCKHMGWSRHIDVARKWKILDDRARTLVGVGVEDLVASGKPLPAPG